MDHKSDWLSWGMHFVLGAVLTGGFSLIFVHGGRRRIPLVDQEHALMFMLGAALIGGAVAARYGDTLWAADSYRVIPPDEPRHSTATLRACFLCNVGGVLMILLALARTYGLLH